MHRHVQTEKVNGAQETGLRDWLLSVCAAKHEL